MLSRKKILTYIGIIILVKIVAFTLFFLYSTEDSKKAIATKKLKIHGIEVIEIPKTLVLSREEKEEQKNKTMQWKLEDKMKVVYKICIDNYDENKSKEEVLASIFAQLETLQDVDVFIANYHEKTLFGSNDYPDVHARTIVLEEIQKVRRRGTGFIVSDIDLKGKKRYVLVRNLEVLELYVGINFIE